MATSPIELEQLAAAMVGWPVPSAPDYGEGIG